MAERPAASPPSSSPTTRMPWIERCLESVRGLDTVVVDHGSTDGTVEFVRERFPEVRARRAGEPRPRGGLEPRHARRSAATHWLILNADAWLTDGSTGRLLDVRRRASRAAALVGPRLLNPDGTLQRSVRGFPTLWRLATEYLFLRKLAPALAAAERLLRGRLRPRRAAPLRLGDGLVHARRGARRSRRSGRSTSRSSSSARRPTGATASRDAGWEVWFTPARRVRPRRRRLARRPALPGERPRPPALPREAPRRARTRSGRAGCCGSRCGARGALFRGERGAQYREVAAWLGSGRVPELLDAMSDLFLLLRLAFATAVVLAPGWAVARALGAARRLGDARVVARARLRGARGHVRVGAGIEADARAAARRGLGARAVRAAGRCRRARPPWPVAGRARRCRARAAALARGGRGRRRRALPPRARPEAARVRRPLARRRSASSPTAACIPATPSRSGTASSR